MKVALLALSAKNTHKTLAPWCLKAYCDAHVEGVECVVLEYTINDSLTDILDGIFAEKPNVLGLSCYIWNVETVAKIVECVRQILPQCKIILGGPEVRATGVDGIVCDYFVQGAGEERFVEILDELGVGGRRRAVGSWITDPSPYTDKFFESFSLGRMGGIQNQLVYYESSRGCPFLCSYCVSSLTEGVEYLPVARVLHDLDLFVEKGAVCVKFVDRTFNADKKRAAKILQHVQNMYTTCTFHFEVTGDLFDDELFCLIERMPKGRVQFEIGVQSTNEETLVAINRKTDIDKVLRNVKRIVDYGNTHIHLDLIAGLPHETLASFKCGVDCCLSAKPHMLQLGVLKILKNTRLRQEADKYGYVYSEFPPYRVLATETLSFSDMSEIRAVTQVAEKFYNSGLYANSMLYAMELLGGYRALNALAEFCRGTNIKASLKKSYMLLHEFLQTYGNTALAEHYVKLDCLTYDPKGQLPDAIQPRRDKSAEAEYRKERKMANVRVEYFELTGETMLFDYSERDAVTKACKVLRCDAR